MLSISFCITAAPFPDKRQVSDVVQKMMQAWKPFMQSSLQVARQAVSLFKEGKDQQGEASQSWS
jgi:hypothetical protein